MAVKINVEVVQTPTVEFRHLKNSDTFVFEPNRTRLYIKLINAISSNAVDHEGCLYAIDQSQLCRKVDVEIKIIIKE